VAVAARVATVARVTEQTSPLQPLLVAQPSPPASA
jgi:hypothetical protein